MNDVHGSEIFSSLGIVTPICRPAAGVFYVFRIRVMTIQPEKLYCPLQHQAFEN